MESREERQLEAALRELVYVREQKKQLEERYNELRDNIISRVEERGGKWEGEGIRAIVSYPREWKVDLPAFIERLGKESYPYLRIAAGDLTRAVEKGKLSQEQLEGVAERVTSDSPRLRVEHTGAPRE